MPMFNLLCYDETSPSGLRWSSASKHHKRPAGGVAGTLRKDGYWQVGYDYKYHLCHRIVWHLNHGEIPEEFSIDHIDRNPSNNKIENLRLSTPIRQQQNRDRKYLQYVQPARGRFRSRLWLRDECICVGTYDTQEEAYHQALARRLELYWVI